MAGQPDAVTVMRSLDPEYGLDEAAVDALKQWRFRPGAKACLAEFRNPLRTG
jgi:Gram-negative bacterial TonB protein C-terminal